MTQTQKEKFEWVEISHSAEKDSAVKDEGRSYHVSSDQFKGFVSLDFFKSLDNTYNTGVKLRSKHLNFVSHEHHVQQVSKNLNLSVLKAQDVPRIESLTDLNAADEESKVSNNKAKSDHSTIEAQRATAPCKKCNYIKEGISTLTCSECLNSWHVQCLDNSDYE
jgi:hypothetical protein